MEHSTNYNLCYTTMNQFFDCIEKVMNKINIFENQDLCALEVNQNILPDLLKLEKMFGQYRVDAQNALTPEEYKVLYLIFDNRINSYDVKLLKRFNFRKIYEIIQNVRTILLGLK